MTLTYTDSHCHLDWFADPAAVAAEAAAAGVARIVIAATTRAHWTDVARCAALPGVYASYGLHPLYQDEHRDDDLHALETQIQTQPTVAIGECGLDFLAGDSAAQRATFAAQIDIARRHRLPLLLHARKSLDAVLHLLQRGGNPRFVIHSFTGSDVQLARIFAQGGYIGIGGTSTYPRAANPPPPSAHKARTTPTPSSTGNPNMPTAHARSQILIGDDGLDRLRHKTVLIAGLGGVGGYCAEAVARAGVGQMIILDHDTVSPSNLNRQLLALHSTLGRKKTEVMRERLLDINPELVLTVCDRFIHPSDAGEWLAAFAPDMLADCIDSIACKAALIAAAQARGIAVISAMGAGNRLDVSHARIRSLNQTSGCPLARELRRALKAHGANLGYPVVYSDEPRRQPLPHQPVGGDVPGRARAVNGTISYLPALFGIMMAGHIIQTLLGETASAS